MQEGSRAPNAKHDDNLKTGGDFDSTTTYGGQYFQKVRHTLQDLWHECTTSWAELSGIYSKQLDAGCRWIALALHLHFNVFC